MSTKTLLLFVLLIPPMVCTGQNSLDFRQFCFNPFLFNPAYAGIDGHTEFALALRQQWTNFDDSPSASGFTAQHPLSGKASIGINFFTQKSAALRTTPLQVAFAYAIPLTGNQFLRFALSGGLRIDDLDLEGRDYSNDPLILDAAQTRAYPLGSFGIVYTVGEFQLGMALPTLFNTQKIGAGPLRTHPLEQLVNQLYSVRYKVDLKENQLAFEPFFLYRLNRDLQNYAEGGSLIHLHEKISTGFSYRQHSGWAIFFGLILKDAFKLSYDYELPAGKKALAAHSHEFQLSYRLVRKEDL
jgi:type IX secretion system PorP/SprF family membrane protein